MVDPKKTDTILDPACGTAGFLISAFKHIKAQNHNKLTPDEQKRLIQNFVGYDISPDMVRLSLVNLYLHGFANPHISEYDTLSSEERWNENFDVVLANPPFMSPKGGIRPHKKFTIKSNRSEVLFVDYIAEHLNPKGRAGIIVPEGVIFQSGTAYKDLRKMLVDNYLYAVVSLPAGVFNPYSGVKTSILLMDKELAKSSNEILFVKIDNDGFNLGAQRAAIKGGQLAEAIVFLNQFKNGEFTESAIAHAVLKSEIAKNGDYQLSGERYKTTLQTNSDFAFVSLEEIIKLSSGNGLTSKNMKVGDYAVYGGNGIAGWHSEYFVERPTIVIGRVGAYCGSIHITKPKAWITDNGLYVTEYLRDDINQNFLSLMLDSLNLNRFAKVGGQPSISQSTVKEQKIPLPPLSVQEEIVAEIEGYQKIIDGAKMVVENYKPKIDIDPEWEMVEFADAPFEIIDGDRGKNYPNGDDFSPKGYCLFLNTKNVRDNGFRFDEVMFISKEKDVLLRKGKLQRGDVLLTTRGTIGNTAYYDDSVPYDNIRINSGMLVFRPKNKELLSEYLYYFFQSENCESQFKKIISGAAQPQLPIRSLKNAIIPLPKIETQRQIVSQIYKEQELVNANKQLIEIFEQKIKDRIAKVWGEEKAEKEQELDSSAEHSRSMAAEPETEYKTD
jgi:type I restriction enzyme M protein